MEKDKYLKLYCNLVELGYGISDDLYGNLEGLHREISLFLNPGQARLHLQE